LREYGVPEERIPKTAKALRAIRADPVKHKSPEALTEYIAKVRKYYPAKSAPFSNALTYLLNFLFQKAGGLVKGAMLTVMGGYALSQFKGTYRFMGVIPIASGILMMLDYFGVVDVGTEEVATRAAFPKVR